jgi:hypothetical protein
MILASMPHSKPSGTYFERRNGKYTLSMQASEKIGLPYGPIPRLLLVWITTEAVRTKKRTLTLGKSLSSFMRQLDIKPTGGVNGSITALKEQMRRLFSTMINCSYDGSERIAGVNLLLVDEYHLWWMPQNLQQLDETKESTITLSERFFEEITKSPIIFYMDALKLLRKSPMALDIYMWLTYKNSYARESTLIPWEYLQMQFGAGYPDDARGKADFKRHFKAALKKVSVVYEDAGKSRFSENGLFFIPGRPHVPKI